MPVVQPVGSSPPPFNNNHAGPAFPPAFIPTMPAAAGTGTAGTGAAVTGENPPPGLFGGLSRGSPSLAEPPAQPAGTAGAGTAGAGTAGALSRYLRASQAPAPVADLLA